MLGLFPVLDIATSDPIQLQPGEMIFLPTDGIEEARSTDGSLFGKERMLSELNGHQEIPVSTVIEQVFQSALDFSGEHPQLDDMTAIALRRNAL